MYIRIKYLHYQNKKPSNIERFSSVAEEISLFVSLRGTSSPIRHPAETYVRHPADMSLTNYFLLCINSQINIRPLAVFSSFSRFMLRTLLQILQNKLNSKVCILPSTPFYLTRYVILILNVNRKCNQYRFYYIYVNEARKLCT